jgi:hypothetical protein
MIFLSNIFCPISKYLRQKEKGNKKVTLVCIDHALKLVEKFGLVIGIYIYIYICIYKYIYI